MAKKKEEPIITHTAILALAGGSIQSEIIKLRRENAELCEKLQAVGKEDEIKHLQAMTDRQVAYHMERLRAVETLYQIESGITLGLIDELNEEGQDA